MGQSVKLQFNESGYAEYPCELRVNDSYVDDFHSMAEAIGFVARVAESVRLSFLDGPDPEPDTAEDVVFKALKEQENGKSQ